MMSEIAIFKKAHGNQKRKIFADSISASRVLPFPGSRVRHRTKTAIDRMNDLIDDKFSDLELS